MVGWAALGVSVIWSVCGVKSSVFLLTSVCWFRPRLKRTSVELLVSSFSSVSFGFTYSDGLLLGI